MRASKFLSFTLASSLLLGMAAGPQSPLPRLWRVSVGGLTGSKCLACRVCSPSGVTVNFKPIRTLAVS